MNKTLTTSQAQRLFEKSGALDDAFESWCEYYALDIYLNSEQYEQDLQQYYKDLKEEGITILSQDEEFAMEDAA